jgi:hypothetical protein
LFSIHINEQDGSSGNDDVPRIGAISFSHIQLYVDKVEDLEVYKAFEGRLNEFSAKSTEKGIQGSLHKRQELWETLSGGSSSKEPVNNTFTPQNRDVVKQLLAGVGFRVTGVRYPEPGDDGDIMTPTRSVLVTSRDASGVQILVSAATGNNEHTHHQPSAESVDMKDSIGVFDASKLQKMSYISISAFVFVLPF